MQLPPNWLRIVDADESRHAFFAAFAANRSHQPTCFARSGSLLVWWSRNSPQFTVL